MMPIFDEEKNNNTEQIDTEQKELNKKLQKLFDADEDTITKLINIIK